MRKWMAILLTAGLCAAGLLQWRGLKEYGGQIFYEYGEKDAPDRALLDQLARQEKAAGDFLPGMAAWSVEEGVEVENRSLGRVGSAARMVVWGDRELAAKRSLAAGNYGYSSDAGACVISRGLAMELFGSVSVVGMEVRCDGADYIVRGVTEDDRKVVILPASANAPRFSYLLLDFGRDRAAKAGADQLLYGYGAGGARCRMDGEVCLALAGFFAILPILTALGRALFLYCRGEQSALRRGAACGAAAAAVMGIFYMMGAGGLRFPPDLIPSRWSDFAFWGQRWEELAPSLRFAGAAGWAEWPEFLGKRTVLGALWGFFGAAAALFTGNGIVRKSLLTLRSKVSKVGIGVNLDEGVSREEDTV